MAVEKKVFATTAKGETVHQFILSNDVLKVSLLDYGATIHQIFAKDKNGKMGDVTVSSNDISLYETSGAYEGKTVARYANRISNGTFSLDGQEYTLIKNEENRATLHSAGECSFHVWAAEVLSENAVAMTTLTDESIGFPGNMKVKLTFTLNDDTLSLSYEMESDKKTVCSPTNHVYFNLEGTENADVRGHSIQIDADTVTPTDDFLIPNGKIEDVTGTAFDLRTAVTLGTGIDSDHPYIVNAKGCDINYCLNQKNDGAVLVSVKAPESGRCLEMKTDLPGVQLYTGTYLPERGKESYANAGFCLETQFYPDTPNNDNFPNCVIEAGEVFKTTTSYRIFV